MTENLQNLRSYFSRNSEGGHLLEVFFVAAVSSIIVIRFFLKITGYPQLGGEGLHIAHLLWGGFFMMVALVLMLLFLNREAKTWAAIVGGIGFGTFIDELGKFITSDNNYFFQPSIAIIYIIFVFLFLFFRAVERRQKLTEKEYLLNALEITKDAMSHDLDRGERRKALQFLEKGSGNVVAESLRKALLSLDDLPAGKKSYYEKGKDWLDDNYSSLADKKWFRWVLILLLISTYLFGFFRALFLLPVTNPSFGQLGHFIFTVISGILVIIGAFLLGRNRLQALQMFKRAALVSIFLTQIFLFYLDQFGALIGLAISLLFVVGLQYMIEQERVAKKAQD